MKNEQKMNVVFKDADNIRYDIKIEITHRNGYPEFSMSGDGNGSSGQCDSGIKPLNKPQKELMNIWAVWHLNGMNAGTENQSNKLKEMKESYEYDRACSFLNSFSPDGKPISAYDLKNIESIRTESKIKISDINNEVSIFNESEAESKKTFQEGGSWIIIKDLKIKEFFNTSMQKRNFFNKQKLIRNKKLAVLNTELETANEKTMLFDRQKDGSLYQYGHGWIRKDLPKTLWADVKKLVKQIEDIEEANKKTGGSWDDMDDKIVVLGKFLELEPNEAKSDLKELGDGLYSYCGTDYYVLTDEEAHDKAIDCLGDELWQMAVENNQTELGKDDWCERVIDKDGYGSILNGWDGLQYTSTDHDYIIMRV